MPAEENRAVKQLQRQLDKLTIRVDVLSKEIKDLKVIFEHVDAGQAIEIPGETVRQALTTRKFSEKEVEAADDMTWVAEEFADIKDEEKEIKKRKKKRGGENL